MEFNLKRAVTVAFGSVKTVEQLRTAFWNADILKVGLSDSEVAVAAQEAVERVRSSTAHEFDCFQKKIEEASTKT